MHRTKSITTGLTIMFVVAMVVPEDWTDSVHFWEIPLGGFIVAVLSLTLLAQLLRRTSFISLGLVGGFSALALTAMLGYIRGNIDTYSLKYFGADLFCALAWIAGYSLARTQSDEDNGRLISRVAMIACLVIISTYIALFTGRLMGLAIENRPGTQSIFNAVGVLIILLPWATAVLPGWSGHGRLLTWFYLGTAVGTAFLSATRSLIIIVVLGGVLNLILRRRMLGSILVSRLYWSIGAVLVLLGTGWSLSRSIVFERFDQTQLSQEARYEELVILWPQISDDLILGQGLGSRFVSNIVIAGNPLASAPHVGIATFLMKGGVPLFVGFVLLPLYVAVRMLLSQKVAIAQRASAASVVVFIGVACLSGGWSPLALFAYGLAISAMTRGRLGRASSRLRYVKLLPKTGRSRPMLGWR